MELSVALNARSTSVIEPGGPIDAPENHASPGDCYFLNFLRISFHASEEDVGSLPKNITGISLWSLNQKRRSSSYMTPLHWLHELPKHTWQKIKEEVEGISVLVGSLEIKRNARTSILSWPLGHFHSVASLVSALGLCRRALVLACRKDF